MKKGTKVGWTTKNGVGLDGNPLPPTPGWGTTISDSEDGKIQVAVESMGEMHHVIWCNVTWLTPLGVHSPAAVQTP